MITSRCLEIDTAGDDLHAMGRVKDFLPYASKIPASGAQAVVTGNGGNALTLRVKAVRELSAWPRLYTFYGNALGVPAVLGDAGVGQVQAETEWHFNVRGKAADALLAGFQRRFPDPRNDCWHARMQAMVEPLVPAIKRAGSAAPAAMTRALECLRLDTARLGILAGVHQGLVCAADTSSRRRVASAQCAGPAHPGLITRWKAWVLAFRTVRRFEAEQLERSAACNMIRPVGGHP